VAEPTYPEGFGGVLERLAVFKRALTAEEIKDFYQQTKTSVVTIEIFSIGLNILYLYKFINYAGKRYIITSPSGCNVYWM
jgi:hypothetical protein